MAAFEPLSFGVATTLAAQRIVELSAANVVALSTVGGAMMGISMDTVLDTTSAIPVAVAGKAKLLFDGTCSAGALVTCDATGRGIQFVNATVSAGYVGRLVGADTVSGTIAEVLIQPGRDSTG